MVTLPQFPEIVEDLVTDVGQQLAGVALRKIGDVLPAGLTGAVSWRQMLRPASFRGAIFHIEFGGQASGRRIALHEYAKRDTPYAEDMGRRARKYKITAYLIGPNYLGPRDALIRALEQEGAGLLVHPTLGERRVACEGYSVGERRERGGYCEFELEFVEAGSVPNALAGVDTQGIVENLAKAAVEQAKQAINKTLTAGGIGLTL